MTIERAMNAVLEGSYAGLRLVKTRRVAVIEIELPIEALPKIVNVLGAPDPASEVPVAIAKLSADAARAPSPTAEENRPSNSKPDGEAARPRANPRAKNSWERTPWHELSRTKQAAIRCSDERFSEYIAARLPNLSADFTPIPEIVRSFCGVRSRAELDENQDAAARWEELDADYRRWAGLETEPRG